MTVAKEGGGSEHLAERRWGRNQLQGVRMRLIQVLAWLAVSPSFGRGACSAEGSGLPRGTDHAGRVDMLAQQSDLPLEGEEKPGHMQF